MSFCFAAVAVAVYVTTFLRPSRPSGLFFVVTLFNLLFWFVAIFTAREPGERRLGIALPAKAPRWVSSATGLLMLFFVLNFASLVHRGTPIDRGGRLFRKTISAQYEEITAAEYSKLKATETRCFAALWLALNTGLGLTLWFKAYHPKKARSAVR